ncbi:MAG: hypothetical protein EZS28_037755, partial [Streblomastix strix]
LPRLGSQGQMAQMPPAQPQSELPRVNSKGQMAQFTPTQPQGLPRLDSKGSSAPLQRAQPPPSVAKPMQDKPLQKKPSRPIKFDGSYKGGIGYTDDDDSFDD